GRVHAGPLYGFLSSARAAVEQVIREQRTRTTERNRIDIMNPWAPGVIIRHRAEPENRADQTQIASYQTPRAWTVRIRRSSHGVNWQRPRSCVPLRAPAILAIREGSAMVQAFSRLKRVLHEQGMTVPELHRR